MHLQTAASYNERMETATLKQIEQKKYILRQQHLTLKGMEIFYSLSWDWLKIQSMLKSLPLEQWDWKGENVEGIFDSIQKKRKLSKKMTLQMFIRHFNWNLAPVWCKFSTLKKNCCGHLSRSSSIYILLSCYTFFLKQTLFYVDSYAHFFSADVRSLSTFLWCKKISHFECFQQLLVH